MVRLTNSIAALFAVALTGGVCAHTQTQPASGPGDKPAVEQSLPDRPADKLPEAPAAKRSASSSADETADYTAATDPGARAAGVVSPEYPATHPYLHRTVRPGMGPQPLTSGQKFELSLRNPLTLNSFASSLFSAGYGQLDNTRPHFGTDKAGFGERLGAAKLRQVTENFLSYGLFASAFHQDPHYYVMGSGHSYKERLIYAPSRLILTRNDAGNTTFNWSKLAGLAGSAAVVNAYYPSQDRGFHQSANAFATSLGTSALTLEINEFLPEVIHKVLHSKNGGE